MVLEAFQKILLIEEDKRLIKKIAGAVAAEPYQLVVFEDRNVAVQQAYEGGYACIIVEWGRETSAGLDFLRELTRKQSGVPVIVIADESTADTAIAAIQSGAYDYLTHPLDYEELADSLKKSLHDSQLMSKPVEIGEVYSDQDTIVGRSRPMRAIYKEMGRIAAKPVTVLVRGETGTGKELVARALYQHGHRAHRRFVAVNCAAIPDELLESELFGHEKGAFTGAVARRVGRFEQAHNGTIFLDEIGELSGKTQAKLLRVLQEKTIQRLGSENEILVDARVIAATHRNLEQLVKDGSFREDLFYRLNVASLEIPPLRERTEDIVSLTHYFLKKFSQELSLPFPAIHTEAMKLLKAYRWPGNVRQLENVLRKALLGSHGYTISQELVKSVLPAEQADGVTGAGMFEQRIPQILDAAEREEGLEAYQQIQREVDKAVLKEAMHRTNQNLAKAARLLGISRFTLREKLRACGLYEERS